MTQASRSKAMMKNLAERDFLTWGTPKAGWFIVKNPIQMDDDWGYRHFRNHPYIVQTWTIGKSSNCMSHFPELCWITRRSWTKQKISGWWLGHPSEQIWLRQLGRWETQYMGKYKKMATKPPNRKCFLFHNCTPASCEKRARVLLTTGQKTLDAAMFGHQVTQFLRVKIIWRINGGFHSHGGTPS